MDKNTSRRWVPVTDRDPGPDGVEFALTPHERDQAKLAALVLEDRRRRLNERDAQRGTHERR